MFAKFSKRIRRVLAFFLPSALLFGLDGRVRYPILKIWPPIPRTYCTGAAFQAPIPSMSFFIPIMLRARLKL